MVPTNSGRTGSPIFFWNQGTTGRPRNRTASARSCGRISPRQGIYVLKLVRESPQIVHNYSSRRAILRGSLMDSESKFKCARMSAGRLSINIPLKKKPGFSSSGSKTNILSINSEGHWSDNKGKLCNAWYLWKSLNVYIWMRRLLRASKGAAGGAQTTTGNILGQCGEAVSELGLWGCNPFILELCLSLDEPYLWRIGPKGRKLYRNHRQRDCRLG